MKEEKIVSVVKKVGEKGKVTTLKNELKSFQNIVGGYIEVYPFTKDILLICNEEGKIHGLEHNFAITFSNGHIEHIVGDIVFVSDQGEDFGSLDDKQISFLRNNGLCE